MIIFHAGLLSGLYYDGQFIKDLPASGDQHGNAQRTPLYPYGIIDSFLFSTKSGTGYVCSTKDEVQREEDIFRLFLDHGPDLIGYLHQSLACCPDISADAWYSPSFQRAGSMISFTINQQSPQQAESLGKSAGRCGCTSHRWYRPTYY